MTNRCGELNSAIVMRRTCTKDRRANGLTLLSMFESDTGSSYLSQAFTTCLEPTNLIRDAQDCCSYGRYNHQSLWRESHLPKFGSVGFCTLAQYQMGS